MKIITYLSTCFLTLLYFSPSPMAEVSVPFKVLRFKGDVKIKNVLLKEYKQVHKKELIPENTIIKTGKQSMVRIKNLKRGSITLGPNSQMVLSHGKSGDPGLVHLMKGQARLLINKYQREDKKHKIYVKTKSAALGVRGTEFLVVHNEENNVTSTISFSGKVDIVKKPDRLIYEETKEDLYDDQRDENILSRRDDVKGYHQFFNDDKKKSLKSGKFSSSFPGNKETTTPTRISPIQYTLLKKNSNLIAKKSKKKKSVYHSSYLVESGQTETLDGSLIPSPSEEKESDSKLASPKDYNEIRPGGVVDLKTGIYIEPPQGAKFNKMSKTYELPKDYGSVDKSSGDYIPPKGLKLHPVKGFILDVKNVVSKNIEKLKLFQSKMNKKIAKGLKDFKELSKLNVDATGEYKYSSNVYENYFEEERNPTNSESSYWDLTGRLSHDTFINRRYLFRPYIGGDLLYHNRRKHDVVKRNDRARINTGIIFHRKHNIFNNKGYFYLQPEWETIYRDTFAKNQWDFYAERYGATIGEKFSFHRKHLTDIAYTFYKIEGNMKSQNGEYQRLSLNHLMDWGTKYASNFNFNFTQRSDIIVTQIYEGRFDLERFKVLRKTNAKLNLKFGRTLSKEKREWDYGAGLNFIRRKGEFLTFNAGYSYLKKESEGSDSFDANIFNLGLTFKL